MNRYGTGDNNLRMLHSRYGKAAAPSAASEAQNRGPIRGCRESRRPPEKTRSAAGRHLRCRAAGVRPVPSRKLAAILSADVSGYSALMSADEEGTVDRTRG
jgi:class 3 adenylate cyclase